MANTNLIYTYIQDSGYKLQYVASVLHISSNVTITVTPFSAPRKAK